MDTCRGWTTLSAWLCLICASPCAAQETIAYWSFNNGFDGGDTPVQIVHPATVGSGVIYQQRADIDSNGKSGVAFVSPVDGAEFVDGKSIAWDDVSKSGENDAEVFVTFSTAGMQGVVLSLDVKGNPDDGIVSFDMKYDTHPLVDVTNPPDVVGTIKDFLDGVSTTVFQDQPVAAPKDSFLRVTYDLSAISDLNDRATVALRLDDWENNDALSIDNLLVTGIAIPEPATATLALLLIIVLVPRGRPHRPTGICPR